jgi:hypothetical protein
MLFFVELGQTSLEVGTLVFEGLRQHVIVFVVERLNFLVIAMHRIDCEVSFVWSSGCRLVIASMMIAVRRRISHYASP